MKHIESARAKTDGAGRCDNACLQKLTATHGTAHLVVFAVYGIAVFS